MLDLRCSYGFSLVVVTSRGSSLAVASGFLYDLLHRRGLRQLGFSSCSTWAQLLQHQESSWTGIKPVSPTAVFAVLSAAGHRGGLVTTAFRVKPFFISLIIYMFSLLSSLVSRWTCFYLALQLFIMSLFLLADL